MPDQAARAPGNPLFDLTGRSALVTNAASYITGQVLPVDGGMVM